MKKFAFQILYLDIRESYFKGKVRRLFREDNFEKYEFTINIQDERRGKVIWLPFPLYTQKRVLVRCSGPGVSVEDFVEYRGEPQYNLMTEDGHRKYNVFLGRIEIDSIPITNYIADHLNQFDTLEIIQL